MIDERAALVQQHRFHSHVVDDEPIAKCTRLHSSASPHSSLMGHCNKNCIKLLTSLNHRICACLRQDRKQRAQKVAMEAKAHLNAGDIHEAYHAIQGWYHSYEPKLSKPTNIDLHNLSREYESLYANRPVVGRALLVLVDQYPIPDGIPSEDEICNGLHHLCKRRAGGPTGMRTELILDWETKNPAAWALFVRLTQESFFGYDVPTAYSNAVLLPKSKIGKFHGITLLEVMYKLWSMIVYLRAVSLIHFHPDIHGFRHCRGCGTATLEAKLEMQSAALHSVPYFQIFLDLTKAYDSIDRDRLIDILAGYGFGPNMLRFLRQIWDNAHLVLRQMGMERRIRLISFTDHSLWDHTTWDLHFTSLFHSSHNSKTRL